MLFTQSLDSGAVLWVLILPAGNVNALGRSDTDSLLETKPPGNQNFPFEAVHGPVPEEECGIFDPVFGVDRARCDSLRGAVCQYWKANKMEGKEENI